MTDKAISLKLLKKRDQYLKVAKNYNETTLSMKGLTSSQGFKQHDLCQDKVFRCFDFSSNTNSYLRDKKRASVTQGRLRIKLN
jgi:hypothetical protein